MKNFILSLAFMLVGTFAFANTGNIKDVQFEPTQEVKTSVVTLDNFESFESFEIAESSELKIRFKVRFTKGGIEVILEIEF